MIRRKHHSTASDQVKPAVHRAPTGASRRRHAVAAAGAAAVAAIVALTSIFAQAAWRAPTFWPALEQRGVPRRQHPRHCQCLRHLAR